MSDTGHPVPLRATVDVAIAAAVDLVVRRGASARGRGITEAADRIMVVVADEVDVVARAVEAAVDALQLAENHLSTHSDVDPDVVETLNAARRSLIDRVAQVRGAIAPA